MKSWLNGFLLAVLILPVAACAGVISQPATPRPLPRGPEIYAVFAGTTPCSAQARPLPQIPADSDCEQMIWRLVLHQDPETDAPTTYSLDSAYGLPKQNTNDLIDGGTPIVMEGNWAIATGTRTDPDAVVYQINPDDPRTTVSFQKINENLIHVLSNENTMLVGHGSWSYTLSRMDNQSPATAEPAGSVPDPPTRPPLPPTPEGVSTEGVFEGRVPCHALVIEVMKIEPNPGCLKIKWRVTLYQDGTYFSMGTSTFREGTWSISHGLEGDAEAVVVQLNLENGQSPVSFLRVDENHLFLLDKDMNLLVGNELFSYTLSRTDPTQH